MINQEPSPARRSGVWRKSPRITSTLAATLLTGLTAPISGAQEGVERDGPDWAKLTKKAPVGLREMAQSKRTALFFVVQSSPEGPLGDLGFFIDDEGLALCPIRFFLRKRALKFHLDDDKRTPLERPKVLGVFPKESLVLLKFPRKPKGTVSLKLSQQATSVGTWVAIVSPAASPDIILGPILSHRTQSIDCEMKNPGAAAKQFSIAVGRGPRQERSLARGAPLLNLKGEVVAIFHSTQPLPAQSFRFATPSAGLTDRIAESAKENGNLKLPIGAEEHGLDPVEYSDDWLALAEALAKPRPDLAVAIRDARELAKEFPQSFLAQKQEFLIAFTGLQSGAFTPAEVLGLAEKFKPLPQSHPAAKAFYLTTLGDTYKADKQIEKATTALQEADEIHPQGMACATLAQIFQAKGDLEKAEYYYRRATSLTPDRIALWDQFQGVLSARRKVKEAEEIFDRVLLLEHLYSSGR